MRSTVRPSGAFKLLTYLLYGNLSHLESMPRNVIKLHSIRAMGKFLGCESRKINAWLIYLEGQGFISELLWSVNKRQVTLRLEGPRNVRK